MSPVEAILLIIGASVTATMVTAFFTHLDGRTAIERSCEIAIFALIVYFWTNLSGGAS